jgi:hypothetical protein
MYYQAYVDCVNNKPVLRDPQQKNTKGVKSDVSLKDGKLNIQISTAAQQLFLKWKEEYIKEHESNVKRIPVPYPVVQKVPVPAEFSTFQMVCLYAGRIALFCLLLFILSKIPWRSFLRL